MIEYKHIGVIGLGKFGFTLAEWLTELGREIVGVDSGDMSIRRARDVLAQVYQADARDRHALEQLRFQDLDCVAVSIGRSMEASILITMNLKEMGVRHVVVKALSEDHEKVLRKVGADQVIFPERFVAKQVAHQLVTPGLVDYLPLGSGVVLRELQVRSWEGRSLRDLDLTNKMGIQIVAKKARNSEHFSFTPMADSILLEGDVLVAVGPPEVIQTIES